MPRRPKPLTPRALAFAIALAAAPGMAMAQTGADVCPLGTFVCPVVKDGFALCKKNDLLDFYVPGLPTSGDRDASPAQVHGEHFSSPDSNIFHLSGNTSLQRLDQLLRTDTLTYNVDTTAYDAEGHVRYQERGLLFSASNMQGTTDPEHGVANNVQYQLLTSRGNGVASQAIVLDQDRARLHAVTYSTCELHHRVWTIEAKTMTMDRDEGVGRAHDVTMRLKGVPFLWLPYLRFPLDDRRQTGFLFPSFGKLSRAGFNFRIPFYWNIAPNYDATFTPVWFTERGAMLDSEFRWLTSTSKGTLDLDYMPHDKVAGRDRGYLNFSNQTSLPGNLQWVTSINRVTDKAWFQDYGQTTGTAVRLLGSSSYLSGGGDWWNAGIGANVYQITDPALSDTAAPYRELPRMYFNADRPIGAPGGPEWGVNAEAVRFVEPEKVGGDRFDLYPHLDWPLQGPAWFVRPELGLRYTTYNLPQPVAEDGPRHPSRSVPIFDVDAGLIFEREVHLFGSDYTQTLEPRMYYLRVPYRNQDDIPLFDTQPFTFDFWQLFTTNMFSGADRQENANNLSLALTTRFLDQDGVEKLSASIGRIRYFDPQKVTLRPGSQIVDHSGSDYVGNLTIALNDHWRLTTSQQWNPFTYRTDVSTVALQRRLWGDGIVNFDYRYRQDLLEQAGMSAEVPVGAAWKLVGSYQYSLREKHIIDAFAGIEWNSCCTRVRLVARHYVYDFQGDFNNAVMIEIEFKGLGAYGQRTDSLLRNDILGYQ
ncbi:MAG TPA: LPS assembly protein LptD [Rhodanobacteraceae bacterium]|nr:LPS assembly protein LptD [Rhodanobacteraceae bacterium]